MTDTELLELLNTIGTLRTETVGLEIKSAHSGTPEKLYDTLSAFSNRDDGGIIVFGIDENNNFSEVGVYDPHDLQKHVVEQCNQMTPKVRPLFTIAVKDDKTFVSAEIPGIDVSERPCYYSGRGRLKGSYTRVGTADEPMTEYEIYSYEAFRKKYQDDIRIIERSSIKSLDPVLLDDYIVKLKMDRPHIAQLSNQTVYELMNILREDKATLSSVMLYGSYPQAYLPQLCIIATVVPGDEVGDVGTEGERFIDNKRIEGTIPQMIDGAMAFVRKNTKVQTIFDKNGNRIDRTEYPLTAVREALLNALIHRDYSIHTEGKPIQLTIFRNRIRIVSPGGLYGRLRLDQLGKVQPDTRNPVLAVAMEILKKTENRYSGIPTIYRELREAGLPDPVFEEVHGEFSVYFYNHKNTEDANAERPHKIDLLAFCKTERTRQDIADYLGIKTVPLVMKRYVMPLVDKGLIEMKYPEKPRSSKQTYKTKG